MAIWELLDDGIRGVEPTTFGSERLRERQDLQRILRENIGVVAPNTLVIAEEYGEWTEGRRRIDLLGIDTDANLVVIELKRTETGGHMELQAVRYAAMVSTMTFAKAVGVYQSYLEKLGREDDAEESLLEFLGWEEPQEDDFASDVRLVLASAEFSRELTTSVMWLNERGLDIRCVRLKPYKLDERLLLDVQQVIPLPEAADYQVQVREKAVEKRIARKSNIDFTRYDLTVAGKQYQGLWKRGVLFAAVQAAIASGAHPEELSKLLPRGRVRFVSVDGECRETEFVEQIATMTTPRGARYKPSRYFTSDDELIHHAGRTYAFSNQWGGKRFFRALKALQDAYPDLGIAYRPTGQE